MIEQEHLTLDDDSHLLNVQYILDAFRRRGLVVVRILRRESVQHGHLHWWVDFLHDQPFLEGLVNRVAAIRVELDDLYRYQHDYRRLRDAMTGILWDAKFVEGKLERPEGWIIQYCLPLKAGGGSIPTSPAVSRRKKEG